MLSITRATLQSFCRTCLAELNKTNKNACYDLETTEDLSKWLSIICKTAELDSDDLLPKCICHYCYTKVRTLFEFRDKATCHTEALLELLDEGLKPSARKNLQRFCRICLKRLRTTEGLPNAFQTPSVDQWILSCLGNDVRSNDYKEFPRLLCLLCFKKLQSFIEFYGVIKKSLDYIANTIELKKNSCEHKTCPIVGNMQESRQIVKAADQKECDSSSNEALTIKNEPIRRTDISETLLCAIDAKFEGSNCVSVNAGGSDCTKNTVRKTKRSIKKLHQKRIKCGECERTFIKAILYEAHIRGEHKGLKEPFRCAICNKSFRKYNYLQRHMRETHNDIKNTTTTQTTLKTTNVSHNKQQNECKICSKVFKRKEHLRDHHRSVHLQIRPFKCQTCGMSFAKRKTCSVHEMIHSHEKPFPCDHCEKSFRQRSELKIHLEVHTENKELLCPICKRIQKTRDELSAHIAAHIASRRFQCPKCGYIFKKHSHLTEHDKAVHQKLRPFKCNYCEKSFALAKTCRTHERLHTHELPEVCRLCLQKFKHKTSLMYHIKKCHNTQEGEQDNDSMPKTPNNLKQEFLL